MTPTSSSRRVPRVAHRRLLPALACALAVPWLAQAPTATASPSSSSATDSVGVAGAGQTAQDAATGSKTGTSATLQQCVTALSQSERSATFAGEMTAIPGTARMEMSIGLLERIPEEQQYHTVSAPGLGQWRGSASGVKTYTHIQQVTNLAAPALYRGAVRFRWLNAKGHVIKADELRTPRCEQPAAPSATGTTGTPAGQLTAG